MVGRARILITALIAVAVLLVLSPVGAATMKCYGKTGAGMTLFQRVSASAQERTLYFQVCVPEQPPK
jgi:hypothetical protein